MQSLGYGSIARLCHHWRQRRHRGAACACSLPPDLPAAFPKISVSLKLLISSFAFAGALHGCRWRCSAAAVGQCCGEAALLWLPAPRLWLLSSRQPSSRSSRSSSRRASSSRAARRGRPRPSRRRARTSPGELEWWQGRRQPGHWQWPSRGGCWQYILATSCLPTTQQQTDAGCAASRGLALAALH